jgi:hypothetical protein
MMKRIWILMMLLALILAGCGGPEVPETTPAATEPIPTVPVRQRYSDAAERVKDAKNLVLDYTISSQRQIGENLFPSKITGKASYSNYRWVNMLAIVEETLELGAYSSAYSETYCEGKANAVVRDGRFQQAMTPKEFTKRQIPAVLLTEELYEKVESVEDGDVTRILFSQPVALEGWVGNGKLISASGEAVLDGEGNLLESSYTARFQTEKVITELEITVEVKTPKKLDLSAIHSTHDLPAILLKDMNAPRRLLQTVADVYNARQLDCQIREYIDSEAIPMSYSRTTELSMLGHGEELQAQVSYAVAMTDYRGKVTQRYQQEQFVDGVYTVTIGQEPPVTDDSVTATAMRQYLEDTVLSGLFAMKYLQEVAVQEEDGLIRYTFTGNESFYADLMKQLTAFLKVDLDAQAQSSRTEAIGSYLVIDPETELPVAMGIYLSRSHTIDTIRYKLDYSLEETLSFGEE